jgi:hypothetical protein
VLERHEKEMRIKKIVRVFTFLFIIMILVMMIVIVVRMEKRTGKKSEPTAVVLRVPGSMNEISPLNAPIPQTLLSG